MRSKRWMIAMTSCLICLFFIGSMAVSAQTEKTESQEQEKIPHDTPLARHGDRELTLSYFYTYAMDYLGQMERMSQEEKKQVLDNTLSRVFFEHAIVDLALEQGYGESPEYIRRTRDMANEWLTKFYVYHQFTTKFEADEEELKRRYEENKEKYFKPLRFSFRHIFFRTIDLPEQQQEQAKEEAEKALALIKSGSDFVEVAKKYSDSQKKGTIVGPFHTREHDPDKAINPVLEEALLKMEPGDVSDIIQTKYGYEILKLESLRPAHYSKFEEVKRTLSEYLRRDKYKEWRDNIIEKYWDEAVTTYNPELIFDEDAGPDAILVTVYGQEINMDDYSYLKGRDYRPRPNESDEEYRERRIDYLKKNIIFDFIAAKLAKELDYDKIPRYIQITNSIRNKKCYSAWWYKINEQYQKDHPITEEEKRQFYEEHSKNFLEKPEAHIAEMTFNMPPHDEEVMYEVFKAEQAAKKKAQKAIQRLKAGEKFEEVAKDMSESPRAEKGGDLGFISWSTDKLPRTVAREALNLDPGTVCDEPIKADDKFYVVTNYEKDERGTMDFKNEKVQSRIVRGILNQQKTELFREYTNKLVDEEKIELLFDDFYTFSLRNLGQAPLDVPK